jgi:hypothetical protein
VPSETDLAWIAGFFDGEGCISARITAEGRTTLQVSIGQKDRTQLAFIQEIFGGSITKIKGKDHYHLSMYATRSTRMLEAIMPYLKLKKPQAVLALEFASYACGQGIRIAENDHERRLEIVTELRQLKRGA